MTDEPPVATQPRPDVAVILQRIRTVAVIAVLVSIVVAVVVLVGLLASLYPSLRATVQNLERASSALAVSTESFAGVSDQAAQNLVDTSANLNAASASLQEATTNLARHSVEDGVAETIIRLLEEDRQPGTR